MKFSFSALFMIIILFSSCQEDSNTRKQRQELETQKRELIFNNITKGWSFTTQPINKSSQELLKSWSGWSSFINELSQKPKSSIGAFQQKSKTLSRKVLGLNRNIPLTYDLPEIKSRISVIETKVNLIDLYIHLNQIPDKKIVQLIKETNEALISFQQQLDEISKKSKIKLEEGEGDMLKMLDTTRAVPSTTTVPKKPVFDIKNPRRTFPDFNPLLKRKNTFPK